VFYVISWVVTFGALILLVQGGAKLPASSKAAAAHAAGC
jgi:hypothetical protein